MPHARLMQGRVRPHPFLCRYLMHQVHAKVWPAVCGVHAKHDKHFSERCQLLRGKLTPTAVGVSRDYECRYPSTVAHLRLIDSLETPLEILYTIQDAMVSVHVNTRTHMYITHAHP